MSVLNKDGCKYLIQKIKDYCVKKTSAGSATKPVYMNANGVPTACNYTLGAACAKGVATTVASGNNNLVTSGAVYSALANKGAYEEGTWTPTCAQGTNQVPTEMVEGKYFKIGNWCYIRGTMVLQNKAIINKVGGLPKVQNHSLLHPHMGITIGCIDSNAYNTQRYHMCAAGTQTFEIRAKDTVQSSAEWMIEGWYLCA